jgi:hypothetical protein
MTTYTAEFNTKQWELRRQTSDYLSTTQAEQVALVESRVDGQLDWLAQLLGFNGPNYWGNLPNSPDQKRQLQGGTLGVYNSYVIPRVLEIRNWESSVIVERDTRLQPGQTVVLGDYEYAIEDIIDDGPTLRLILPLTDQFLSDFSATGQIKVDVPSVRPAPFYRPTIGIAGDAIFRVGVSGDSLVLYPGWDTGNTLPYAFPILMAGSRYWFNVPVYLLCSDSVTTVQPVWDVVRESWYLDVPANLSHDQVGLTATLVWDYSDTSTQVSKTLEVKVQPWVDPTDWNTRNVLQNFLGAWSNKGGALPFNLAFDSLSVHGFDEARSVLLQPVVRSLSFNDLLDYVYYQRVPIYSQPPGNPQQGDIWWNNETGVLAVWYYQNATCSNWVEVDYRIPPDDGVTPTFNLLRFIAATRLFPDTEYPQGSMWWDWGNPDEATRAASIRYDDTWVSVNTNDPLAAPDPTVNLGVLYFYCDGVRLTSGVSVQTDDYRVTYTESPSTGTYEFEIVARTQSALSNLPTISISDTVTQQYIHNVSDLVYGGLALYASPNVYDCETPLRLWKAQDLQVVNTVQHLAQDTYANPLRADLNTGPGPDNWERYFVRLPPTYGRNDEVWQKVNLICQDFGYWGSTIEPEFMRCPSPESVPEVYEEVVLFGLDTVNLEYIYAEPYLYSNIAYGFATTDDYANANTYPTVDLPFDEFAEATLTDYDPLHNRRADTTAKLGEGYGDWEGMYLRSGPCTMLSGFLVSDLEDGAAEPMTAPIWDASIYKYPPTCENAIETYTVDANHFKVGYAYFIADLSAAEDGFFDPLQEIAWRYPVSQGRTGYLLPR